MSDVLDRISRAQKQLNSDLKCDGWLIFDGRFNNSLARSFLDLPLKQFVTRRFFYWIPKQGECVKICQSIEEDLYTRLPGKTLVYRSWIELLNLLKQVLGQSKTICMEHSSDGDIPVLCVLDAGTYQLLTSWGIQIHSSWPLLANSMMRRLLSLHKTHQEAAQFLDETAKMTWTWIEMQLRNNKEISEWDVQAYILSRFNENGYETDHEPICAVGPNSALPHYLPMRGICRKIHKDEVVLIDLWAKKAQGDSIYADITRVGFTGNTPPSKIRSIFDIVSQARDQAIEFLQERFASRNEVRGFEVDDVCRGVIKQAGYGDYFTHRTGHSIDENTHGKGVNIDNLETHDDRVLLPGACFSIEPGIYLEGKFGIRLECDALINESYELEITGCPQKRIYCIQDS